KAFAASSGSEDTLPSQAARHGAGQQSMASDFANALGNPDSGRRIRSNAKSNSNSNAKSNSNANVNTNTSVNSRSMGSHPWRGYFAQLRSFVDAQPSGQAAKALTKAASAEVDARQGDLGLDMTASFTDYPNGAGSGTATNNTFTNLRQYGELRLNWQILGFFTRRPGRVDSARAQAEQRHYQNQIDKLQVQQAILIQQVAAWASAYQHKALERGRTHAEAARHKIGLAHSAPTAHITGTTLQQVRSAAEISQQIRSALAGLPQVAPQGPQLPTDYSALPLQPPSAGTAADIARKAPQVLRHRALARADSALARSYWGNGVKLGVYGGYIVQQRMDQNGVQNGPEAGLKLTVPIGSEVHNKRAAAQWRAKAEQQQAKASIRKRTRYMQQLRKQWLRDAAALQADKAAMKRSFGRLHTMNLRAKHSAAGIAPEPGTLSMQTAKFWLLVSQVWKARAKWMTDALTWGLIDPTLFRHTRQSGSSTSVRSLCAPLDSCKPI
ncbi:MAG: hypothetical protein L0H29_09575, partial [Sinobacteraceae bacterium]|nr:hypothetical protein [Nevskiaceae bacterium]